MMSDRPIDLWEAAFSWGRDLDIKIKQGIVRRTPRREC